MKKMKNRAEAPQRSQEETDTGTEEEEEVEDMRAAIAAAEKARQAEEAATDAFVAYSIFLGGAVVGARWRAYHYAAVTTTETRGAQADSREADAVGAAHPRARDALVAVEPTVAWVAEAAASGAQALARALIGASERCSAVGTCPSRLADAFALAAFTMS